MELLDLVVRITGIFLLLLGLGGVAISAMLIQALHNRFTGKMNPHTPGTKEYYERMVS